MTGEATRTLVVHVVDWPLVAAGVPASEPAVVVRANRRWPPRWRPGPKGWRRACVGVRPRPAART